MKRFLPILLVLFLLGLPSCGKEQTVNTGDSSGTTETIYHSDTSRQDCYLCGEGIENLVPFYWGQNNIALISLNTFDIKPIEINRYDRLTRQLIEEYAGTVSLGGGGSIDGGFSADLLLDYDKGYASGSINFYDDTVLDANKAAAFLCEDCLNELLPQEIDRCFGVGAIDLSTKEIRVFEESLGGFGLGDFHIDCDLKDLEDGSHQMSILMFYCPIRYEKEL